MKIVSMTIILITIVILLILYNFHSYSIKQITKHINSQTPSAISPSPAPLSPLSIFAMREKSYPGSMLTFEKTLSPGTNFKRYLVSYVSEGLKNYGLLTIPTGVKPPNGWPIILFNHGYIPPKQYDTDTSYSSMVTPLAQSGYIVFKPDYRGNGNSEGTPVQIYISPDYVTDSLNGLRSVMRYPDVNPRKIGVFGHSMGGNITLHELVISHAFEAAEIISGVVGNQAEILHWWDQRNKAKSIVGNDLDTFTVLVQMENSEGTPQSNPSFWSSLDFTNFLTDISSPVEIQVGTSDTIVPPSFSSYLRNRLIEAKKDVEYKEYPGADHNLSPNLSEAMAEAIAFFNRKLQ